MKHTAAGGVKKACSLGENVGIVAISIASLFAVCIVATVNAGLIMLFYLSDLYSESADFSLLLGISTCAGGPAGLDLTSLLLAILVGGSR